MKYVKLWFSGAAVWFAIATTNGVATEESFPKQSGEVGIEIQNDFTFDSDDAAAEQNELGTTIEPTFTLRFNEAFSINTELTLEA